MDTMNVIATADPLIAEEEQMTLYVKTLAGDIYPIRCSVLMPSCDFPFQVLPHLPEPRPPVSDLRLYPASIVEQDNERIRHPFYFPIHFSDGDIFYLFVEPPQLDITIQFVDNTTLCNPDQIDDMEVYRLCIKSSDGDTLIDHLFYTLVYHPYVGASHPRKYYTDIYYHEDDIEVIYNPAPSTRANEGIYEREIALADGATAFESPSFFASMCIIPSYISYLCENIHRVWMEHVRATGMPELQHYVHPEDEYELYGRLSDGE